MASRGSSDRHLDATAGREVVYCHNCYHEWYFDSHDLICPNCQGEITEIIDPNSDPRAMSEPSASPSPELQPHSPPFPNDSDPDEANIEEHVEARGLHFRRSTRRGPNQRHHDASAAEPIFGQLFNMFHQSLGDSRQDESPRPYTHRTTFTSGLRAGTTSVTIFTGHPIMNSRGDRGNGGEGIDHLDDSGSFHTIFSNVIRELGPPDPGETGGPQIGFARSVQEILSLFNPANAMTGDAVYSQEALDRIITQLMEANPPSLGAPPASEEALHKLDRRSVDKHILGPEGKAECSICIDEMKEGETAVFLPCKHWFHEECVVLWLKEHNTCPVCRSPIEERGSHGRRFHRNQHNNREGASAGPDWFGRSNIIHPSNLAPSYAFQDFQQAQGSGGRSDSRADTPTGMTAGVSSVRLDSQGPSPASPRGTLDEGHRSTESASWERGDDSRWNRTNASGPNHDSSRTHRRTSHSPTTPRATNLAEQGARMRQRSPSESSSRHGSSEREDRRRPGTGPLNWLRDRLSGSGSSGGAGRPSREGGQS